MKNILKLLFLSFWVQSCGEKAEVPKNTSNWEKRSISSALKDSLVNGTTYLSVYSQIYSQSEHRTLDLTATISMRNPNTTDTIFIKKADYFNTEGKPIRNYLQKPIFVAPLETVEIVIEEKDRAGGTGANFLFHWATQAQSSEPLFEAIMISTSGQQGISFTTQGKRLLPIN